MTSRAATSRGVVAALIAAVLVLVSPSLLGGCAPLAEPPAAAPELPDGVTVELRQGRADVAARQAAVTVHNDTDLPLTVGMVSVADPRFAEPATRVVDRTSTLAPGAGVDVRVQLGAIACAVPDDAVATLTLQYSWDGQDAVAVVPVSDPVPFLAALHERECVQVEAERSAVISLGAFTPSDGGEPARLVLSVVPTGGDGRLRVTGIRETNLLTLAGVVDSVLPLDVDQTGTDRRAVDVDLPLLPARCDAHVVQEDKRGTVFRLLVEVDGRAGSFDLAASPELRAEILGWIGDWCGFGG